MNNNHFCTSFPTSVRLRRPSEFRHAFSGRRISRGGLLAVHTPKQSDPNQDSARLGIIVAKRFAPRAVTRNTIKRMIREHFRLKRTQLPPVDLVIRLHRAVPHGSLRQLKQHLGKELHWHFRKIADDHAKENHH
ncbi:MAG TPA: ribonuclease P protein component [Paenalcaligenes sp.]|nr:ribonuclease P protein component [Paenalcaligenes sp.]